VESGVSGSGKRNGTVRVADSSVADPLLVTGPVSVDFGIAGGAERVPLAPGRLE